MPNIYINMPLHQYRSSVDTIIYDMNSYPFWCIFQITPYIWIRPSPKRKDGYMQIN